MLTIAFLLKPGWLVVPWLQAGGCPEGLPNLSIDSEICSISTYTNLGSLQIAQTSKQALFFEYNSVVEE
jgi:hypothetical protein